MSVEVRHSRGSYRVRFDEVDACLAGLSGDSYVLTDSIVGALYAKRLPEGTPVRTVPAGESSKRLDVLGGCLEWLAEIGAGRNAVVVALGGGVVGDLAGFVAATYMRGVRLLQIPTTLLAMVDSSVGGKVGIDLEAGKNLAGAFWPPSEVVVCTGFLKTLPAREFAAGMAEVWKYGYIMDEGLCGILRQGALDSRSAALPGVVERCIELKREVVESDEFETTGRRAILNFGHTIGHALEQVTGYERYLHGEAVSIGMVVEARLGESLGTTPKGASEEIAKDLQAAGLPVRLPSAIDRGRLLDAMLRDKKRSGEGLPFSLLTGIGGCKLVTDVRWADVEKVLDGE